MEKPQLSSLKPLSPQEWDTLIDDYQSGEHSRYHRWTTTSYTGFSLLDLSLSSLLRKDFPINLKLNITVFIEEYFNFFEPHTEEALIRLVDTLRAVIQAPIDGVSVTYSLKDQLMISTTSTFVDCTIDGNGKLDGDLVRPLESLIELLLTVINRPNHGQDRQTRAVACECLRELERACPSLLSEIAEHLWGLCQNERTHAAQSYVLLFGSVIHGVVMSKSNVSITNTTIPLLPFNVPQFLLSEGNSSKEISSSSYKELRKAISFLLEWPHNLTPCGLVEFMCIIMPVAAALELQVSLLKVKFSGLLYTYDPLLCHAFLGMYLRFLDAFEGQESEVTNRLVLISREAQHHLVFRLLALHWLLGLIGLISSREVGKKKAIVEMSSRFYPTVFDPLALKSLKLDLLGYCSILIDYSRSTNSNDDLGPEVVDSGVSVVKLFEDGLVSVSGFKWLPPRSTETAVAFRTFHKFLIGASSHSDTDSSSTRTLMESTIFHNLQRMLVDMMLEFRGLVPVIVAFIDRLLSCDKHRWLGERLLQTLDEHLVPKVKIDYKLGSYFPVFDRIAENDTVPPGGLLELLTKFMVLLIEKHGPDTGLKSWSQGSKVLGICRTMLMHHHSSRLFLGLSRLLAFTCLYFPDLEVRDNARIYLRMLICIPGKRLRHILNTGGQLPGISQSPHAFSVQSPRLSHDLKKSKNISSYIHLERVVPLLVKQLWSLSLSTLGIMGTKPGHLEPIRDNETSSEQRELDTNTTQPISEIKRIDHPQEPLRVMDSKFADIVGTLRRHFSSIPDFRHMPGLKITIFCSLRFESEPFNRIWGVEGTADDLDGIDVLPAIYATVLTFSSSAPYGSIPSLHIPFLLGESPKNDYSLSQTDSLAIIPVENNNSGEEERLESFKAPLMVELEPREPIPGLVDVSIETNAENGQIIRGNLQNITVGIEDMFLKAIVPEDIQGEAVCNYNVDLFDALWEACGTSSSTGRETFPLKGGKGVAAISGTRSVKLLEVHATSLIRAIERHLAPFVVSVIGEPLVNIVKNGGIIKDIIWKYSASDSSLDVTTSDPSYNAGPLYLKYSEEEEESGSRSHIHKRNMGNFHILIFLPPRFHLLFQMEVSDVSTLVRIRTDHWPCLAYIDEYLEALFFG